MAVSLSYRYVVMVVARMLCTLAARLLVVRKRDGNVAFMIVWRHRHS